MSDTDILNQILQGMGFGGSTYHFDILTPHYKAVFVYLLGAGIPEDVLRTESAIGCLMKGVTDSYYMVPGQSQFSQMFYQLATQLMCDLGSTSATITADMSDVTDDMTTDADPDDPTTTDTDDTDSDG